MEKISSYNVDIDKTAYMNWRTRPHQPIHDMMIIADGYMKAAIMLAQDCLQDNMDKKADIVVFPILFSANHAIELYLKSINWSLNMLLNEKESFCGADALRHRSFVLLDGSVSGFTSSDSNHLFDRHHENLSVADLVGTGGFHNRFDRHVDQRVVDHALNLHLGQKVHDVLRTTVKFGMSFLTAETFDLGHGHTLNTNFCECLSHFVKFEGLDNSDDLFHFFSRNFFRNFTLKVCIY